MMETHRFRNDTQTRKRLMVPDSFAHPAKGHLGLWQTMIERYSQPGDLVLDPMAGVGTTLVAALMGRNVICVELEPHFVDPMRRSWEKMRQMPMLGCEMGQVVILRGDAWCLPLPDASVGVAITSPLYEGSLVESDTYQRTAEKVRRGEYTGKRPDVCFAHPNIGAQGFSGGYTRPVDAIVTSPPFQDQTILHDMRFTPPHHTQRNEEVYSRYTRPVDAIVTSPVDEVADVRYNEVWKGPVANTLLEPVNNADPNVTAELNGVPDVTTQGLPQGECQQLPTGPKSQQVLVEKSHISGQGEGINGEVQDGQGQDKRSWNEQIMPANPAASQGKSSKSTTKRTAGNSDTGSIPQTIFLSSALPVTTTQKPRRENVGNLRGQAYWDSMSEIYAECWRVLRPGGLMALVLKGFTRDGQYVDLPGQTETLLLGAGWVKHDHWRRELWSLSFWRILQKRRDPAAFDERLKFEEVLAFRKGAA